MALFSDESFGPERSMVLVASADGPTRVALTRTIARLGLTTVVTFDGEAALIAAHDHEPTLLGVVLDAQLPLLSGWDVARTLQFSGAELPLVVLEQDAALQCHGAADVAIVQADDLSDLTASLSRLIETWAFAERVI